MKSRSTHSDRTASLAAWSCLVIAGCAGIETSESQLFGDQGSCRNATITYRVEHDLPRDNASRSAFAKLLNPAGATRRPDRRVTTLAVRYPHPTGRAGFARVECITATAPGADDVPAAPRGWLQRVRRLAVDTMPGITMADGVHEALGLDVPIGELEEVLAKLQQPLDPSEVAGGRAANGAATQVSCTVNDAVLPARYGRVAELDRLVARVRRDGGIISHTASAVEPTVDHTAETLAIDSTSPRGVAPTLPAQSVAGDEATVAAAQLDAAVVPASYSWPTTPHLPVVETAAP